MRSMSGLDSFSFQLNYRADLHFLFLCFPRKKLFFLFFLFSPSPSALPPSPRHLPEAGRPSSARRSTPEPTRSSWAETSGQPGPRPPGGSVFLARLPPVRAAGSGPGPCGPSAAERAPGSGRLSRLSRPRALAGAAGPPLVQRAGAEGSSLRSCERSAVLLPQRPRGDGEPSREPAAWGARFWAGGRGPAPSRPRRLRPAPAPQKMSTNSILHFNTPLAGSRGARRANPKREAVIYGWRVGVWHHMVGFIWPGPPAAPSAPLPHRRAVPGWQCRRPSPRAGNALAAPAPLPVPHVFDPEVDGKEGFIFSDISRN